MSLEAFNLLREKISEPLTLVDVGARWGAVDFWGQFQDKAQIYCFEADFEEARRLASENTSPQVEYIPLALGAGNGNIEVHITEGPGCSSVYPPLPALYQKYPGCAIMRPVRTLQSEAVALDNYFESRGLNRIHALKLDTQGSELEILKGSDRLLRGCLFVNVEVEFNALYAGQPLFCDVDKFLRERGFVLWRLNNLAHYSTGLVGGDRHPILLAAEPGSYQYVSVDNGQLFWADAFYVKADACATSEAALSSEDAMAGACLVAQWRLWDLALEMVRKPGDLELFAKLQQMLRPPPPPQPSEDVALLRGEIAALKARIAEFEASPGRARFRNWFR